MKSGSRSTIRIHIMNGCHPVRSLVRRLRKIFGTRKQCCASFGLYVESCIGSFWKKVKPSILMSTANSWSGSSKLWVIVEVKSSFWMTTQDPTGIELLPEKWQEVIEMDGEYSQLPLSRPPPWHSATPNAKGCNFFLKKSIDKRSSVKVSLNIQLRFAESLSVGLLVKKLWPLPKSPPTFANSN